MFKIGDFVYHKISKERGMVTNIIQKNEENEELSTYEISMGFNIEAVTRGCELKITGGI